MAGTDVMVSFKVFLCSLIDIVVRVLREGEFWRDMAFWYHLEASVCFARKGDIFSELWVFMGFSDGFLCRSWPCANIRI
jgi:hypothetical protein